MASKRSVHGGDDSHLCVEVSAVRFGNGETTLCNHAPSDADAFAVYLCNPLAHWLADILTPRGAERLGIAYEIASRLGCAAPVASNNAAKVAAFKQADALAEHLGCNVVSALARNPH